MICQFVTGHMIMKFELSEFVMQQIYKLGERHSLFQIFKVFHSKFGRILIGQDFF